MTLRHRPLLLCALCLCCAPLFAAPPVESTPAIRLWEQGQDAMLDGRNVDAIRFYQESLRLDPQLSRNFLSLAAAHIADGHEAEAMKWLATYLEARPDHHVVRLHYADMLLRQGKVANGRTQLERFIADVQEREDLAAAHLLDCHTKLVEIAEAGDDEYNEHLHRGIGLFLLGCQRAQLPGAADGFTAESLWLKAAAELGQARLRRPTEARPCWYLHEVWSRLAQQHPATRWLRAAESAAPFSYLTPAEQRRLTLACRLHEDEGRLK